MFLSFFASLRQAHVPVTPREYLVLMQALDQDLADTEAAQVQRAGGLEIAELHARRIGDACRGGELRSVDDVAAIRWQCDVALRLIVR